MAVFVQYHKPCAVGFDTPTDALDFLFWGYEARELLPCGTYDLFTDEVQLYRHQGIETDYADPELIRQTARAYLTDLRRLGRF
ncbi:hypothetical protein [Spirosoma luteolum]